MKSIFSFFFKAIITLTLIYRIVVFLCHDFSLKLFYLIVANVKKENVHWRLIWLIWGKGGNGQILKIFRRSGVVAPPKKITKRIDTTVYSFLGVRLSWGVINDLEVSNADIFLYLMFKPFFKDLHHWVTYFN